MKTACMVIAAIVFVVTFMWTSTASPSGVMQQSYIAQCWTNSWLGIIALLILGAL